MQINDTNFESEVLKSNVPVLVDFFAPWCGPCQMQSPIIDELIADMAGKPVKIFKMNADESSVTSARYSIMSIPTLIIFVNGEVKEVLNGVHMKDDLKSKLEALM